MSELQNSTLFSRSTYGAYVIRSPKISTSKIMLSQCQGNLSVHLLEMRRRQEFLLEFAVRNGIRGGEKNTVIPLVERKLRFWEGREFGYDET